MYPRAEYRMRMLRRGWKARKREKHARRRRSSLALEKLRARGSRPEPACSVQSSVPVCAGCVFLAVQGAAGKNAVRPALAGRQKMTLSELLGVLHDRYGRCPSYQTVWRRAAERRIPSRRDEPAGPASIGPTCPPSRPPSGWPTTPPTPRPDARCHRTSRPAPAGTVALALTSGADGASCSGACASLSSRFG